MVSGDQYRCDWCTFSWRTKSDSNPIRCPSCGHGNIINEAESFRKILGKENILDVDKKVKKKPEVVEEEIEEEKGFFSKIFKKK